MLRNIRNACPHKYHAQDHAFYGYRRDPVQKEKDKTDSDEREQSRDGFRIVQLIP